MDDIPLDQKAREVAEWLGWRVDEVVNEGADFDGGRPCPCFLNNKTISTLHAACLRERRLRAVVEEAIEPGVFGSWGNCEDPALKATNLADLCERHGYGAVMHYTEYLWRLKAERIGLPGSEHTCAACASVRRTWLASARLALELRP